ncbi:hypothetical protein AMAG_19069 [Allomyces macrogynus ATCC 38327]|uniref:Uncharacterized protein n=1 Tax=Allomyces macrogynus (strain ATCC 38327) TaxID=578462 RepID=A0A0L0SMN8_ALLM3|nr:hypothetical protein AMAG_19069 [Allomyces macrogynus ATCC 38327]|eukprot:KNE63821.1 hypothetical protein AMAG_19069 [Allomyces macrogynus ATCC 38327]
MFIKTNAWDDALEAAWNTGNLDSCTRRSWSSRPSRLRPPCSCARRHDPVAENECGRPRRAAVCHVPRFGVQATAVQPAPQGPAAAARRRSLSLTRPSTSACTSGPRPHSCSVRPGTRPRLVMPHLLVLALIKPEAWTALAQEAMDELHKAGVSLGGGIGGALAALAEDPQDLESLGKKLTRLSPWHGSKSLDLKVVLEIVRFQALQRRVILLAHNNNFVDLMAKLAQMQLQRTKSAMSALLQLLAELLLLNFRQGALPELLAFSKDLHLLPGHVVISPVIVKAVIVVSGAAKGDLVVVGA